MVALKILVLVVAVMCEAKANLVPQAIVKLVQNNYGDSSAVIEIFYNSRKVKNLDETLKLLSREKQFKITPIDMNDLSRFENEYCTTDDGICIEAFLKDAIFLFDTMESYQKFKDKLFISVGFKAEISHFVYCEDASDETLQQIMTRNTYESFLLVKNDQISLHSMTMFTEKQCGGEELVEINQFSSLERKWTTEKFFMPRIDDFHGCELRIKFYPFHEAGLPFVRLVQEEDGTETAEGAIVDMVEALSTHLNFTFTHTNGWHYDIFIEADSLVYFGNSNSHSSDPIYITSDICVVPPGEFYTSWEKVLLPFDWETWMWLGITFAVAFLVILLIKVSKSTSLYDLVIGYNVATPSLNVIAIFMGIGQILLPQRIVTRFLFINFVLFSLIMRTAYQGKYFEFLTSDMRRKPIQTLQELKDNNFTVIVNELNTDLACLRDLAEKG